MGRDVFADLQILPSKYMEISVPYLNMMTLVQIVLCSIALSKHPRAESVDVNVKSGGELVHGCHGTLLNVPMQLHTNRK